MKNLPCILYLINIEKFSYRNILCFSPFPPQGKIVFCFIYYFAIFITDRILFTFRDEIQKTQEDPNVRYVCEREIVKRQVVKIEWRRTIEEIRDPKTRRLFIAGRKRMDVHLLAYVYISPFYVGKTFMSPDYSQAGNWSMRPRIARVFLIDYFKACLLAPKRQTLDVMEIKLASLDFRESCFLFLQFYDESIALFAITLTAVNRIKVNEVK